MPELSRPTVNCDFLTKYDPLESDAEGFGRELFLGDINRLILNVWDRPPKSNPNVAFDFNTWLPICQLRDYLYEMGVKLSASSYISHPSSFFHLLQAESLRLCFTNEGWANRCSILESMDQHKLAYAGAKKSVEICLENGILGTMSNNIVVVAQSLLQLGLYQESKKELEPALRFLRLTKPNNHGATLLYRKLLALRKDKPKVDFNELKTTDPLGPFPGDYSTAIIQKIRPAYIEAIERIYGKDEATAKADEPKPFSDLSEQSSPAQIAQVATAAHEAMGQYDFNEACRLFTIAHLASKRRNPYFVLCRAECHSHAERMLEAYIDSCEAIRLNSSFIRAYECKVTALCYMGFPDKAREVFKDAQAVDPSYTPDPFIDQIDPGFRTHKYDTEMIDDAYDPTLSDYTGDGMRLTASERKVLKEILDIKQAQKLFEEGNYLDVIDLLNSPIEAFPQPDVLTLRARAFLETQEPKRALADAEAALKLDMSFHGAIFVRGKALAEMGLNAKARQALEGYLDLVPNDDAACALFNSLAGKRDINVTRDETGEDIINDTAYYGPESLETSVLLFTQRIAERLKITYQNTRKYNPPLKHSLRHHFLKAEKATFDRLTVLENELQKKEMDLTLAHRKQFTTMQEHLGTRMALKESRRANIRLTKQVDELQASIDATFKDGVDHLEFKKLKEELAEKDKALSHSNKVYDGLLQQHENLKSEYERSKASRATKKAAARANDEAAEELERLKEEHAKTLVQLDEARKAYVQTQADLTKKLHDTEGAYQGKLRRIREQLHEAEDNAREEANRAAQLAMLLEDEKRTIENLTVQVNELLDASTTATQTTQSASTSMVRGAGLEGLKGAVFATLFSFPDGITLEPLKQAVRVDANIEGEEEARKCGYASFHAFLHSEEMAHKVAVYYEAKPDPSVQHLRDAQEESGRHAREKLRKQLFFERKNVDRLKRQLKAAEEQIARKQAELAKKDEEIMLQPLCPVCWLRQCDTTFEVPEPKGAICGHLICLHCANGLSVCHFCRKKIVKRVKLYTGQSPSSSA
ncbi:hypothetical protein AAVH_09645 [Aphelenchoides avenae]|nr:hypothetical protein AAVH_09645 [Aphelenchus avenae]